MTVDERTVAAGPAQEWAGEEPVREVKAEPPHWCAVPELDAGERWTCPEPDCGQTYGQQFASPPPGHEVVNIGDVLGPLAEACINAGHSFAQGVPPREVQNALYRLGGQVQRAASVFGHIGVALPREQPRG